MLETFFLLEIYRSWHLTLAFYTYVYTVVLLYELKWMQSYSFSFWNLIFKFLDVVMKFHFSTLKTTGDGQVISLEPHIILGGVGGNLFYIHLHSKFWQLQSMFPFYMTALKYIFTKSYYFSAIWLFMLHDFVIMPPFKMWVFSYVNKSLCIIFFNLALKNVSLKKHGETAFTGGLVEEKKHVPNFWQKRSVFFFFYIGPLNSISKKGY